MISSLTLAQGWNTVITTNINISNAAKVEMHSNSFGNNVIVQTTTGALKYYVMNTNGVGGLVITIESRGASHANITGDGNKVYLVYKKSDRIKVKYSTNAGTSWSTLNDLVISPSGLDAIFYDNKLHVTYSVNNLAKYYQYNGTAWVNSKAVSETETGTNPRIEIREDDNKVYVAYDNGDNCRSREYNVTTNSWGDRKTLYSGLSNSTLAGFGTDANYIYLYYHREIFSPSYEHRFYGKTIRKSDYTTTSNFMNPFNQTFNLNTTTTADNIVHTAFYYQDIAKTSSLPMGVNHFYFNNGSESSESIYQTDLTNDIVDISSTHNDLHVIWYNSSSTYLKYRQYDTTPSTPQNLSVASYNDHPKLTWEKNGDADVDYYRIYKKKGSGSYSAYATTTSTEYVDNAETMITGPLQAHETTAKYKVSVKDLGGFESDYSNEVEARIEGEAPEKVIAINIQGNIDNYGLDQNYPNPFNPTTSIKYSVKEKGFVSLKVYDMLGKEVADLVNEKKEIGQHSVNFDASELPSGIYIYSIRANNFSQSHKMLLLK